MNYICERLPWFIYFLVSFNPYFIVSGFKPVWQLKNKKKKKKQKQKQNKTNTAGLDILLYHCCYYSRLIRLGV